MTRERFRVEVDGQEIADLYPDVRLIEVDLEEDAAAFRIELGVTRGSDGAWSHVDDDRLAPWRTVAVSVGFDDGLEPLVSGRLVRIDTTFEPEPGRCRIELLGADDSALMDRVERLRAWPDRRDSDVAEDVFAEYALDPDVDPTAQVHGAAVSTIVQRETDLQFLRRLARRNGYECFVADGRGHFRAPRPPGDPQPVLAVHFGDATTVSGFTVRLDARTPTDVGMYQIDRVEKTVLSATATSTRRRPLGADDASALRPPGLDPAMAYVAMNASTGTAEMEPLCQSLYDRGDWFVTGEGVVDGLRYGAVLRPRRPVTIKGVGERHSGVWAVTRVTHVLDAGGYTQRFEAKRNALRPDGTENFAGGGSLPGGLS